MAPAAHAQPAATPGTGGSAPPPLAVELNRLEPRKDACRVYLLLRNRGADEVRSLKLDLFVIDKSGVVGPRLAVQVGPLAAGKTAVKLFDFPGASCDAFGQVLLNDVLACEVAGETRHDCLSAIATDSKSSVPLIK